MRIAVLVAAVLLLAGCGVDGPPEPPPAVAPGGVAVPGVGVSGEVQVGVTGGTR